MLNYNQNLISWNNYSDHLILQADLIQMLNSKQLHVSRQKITLEQQSPATDQISSGKSTASFRLQLHYTNMNVISLSTHHIQQRARNIFWPNFRMNCHCFLNR